MAGRIVGMTLEGQLFEPPPDPLQLAEISRSWLSGCPCGTPEYGRSDRIAHARWHLDWASGVRCDDWLASEAPIATVTGASPQSNRTVAYQLACLMQREEGYDFPLLPNPSSWRKYAKAPTAFVAIWHHRAIALAIVGTADRWGWDRVDSDGYVRFDELSQCRALAGVFVSSNYRGRGVGRRLVQAVAELEQISAKDLAWLMPLSSGGRALAKSIAGDDLRLCGDVAWE